MADNPLVGRVDADTIARTKDILTHALRPVRIRLVNRMGADVPLSVVGCELASLDKLRDRLVEDEVRLLAHVRMQPAGVSLMLGLDTGLLFRMIGMLLGEYGPPESIPVEHRPLTSADLRIARRLLEDLVAGLQDGLPSAAAGQQLTIVEVSDDPNIDLGLSPTASVIDTAIEVGHSDAPIGAAILCVPAAAVRVLIPEAAASNPDPQRGERGLARVLPIRVDAVAELARVKTRLSQIGDLSVGDLLPIGRPSSIEVRVRDRVALIAEPGTSDTGKRCIRVLRNVHDLGHTA